MEYPNSVLHEDVLIVVIKAFYSVDVFIVTDCAFIVGFHLVAVCLGFCGFFAGIHGFVVCSKLKVVNPEESQFLLFVHHLLGASPIVRLGKFDGYIKVALFKRLNDNVKRNRRIFFFA